MPNRSISPPQRPNSARAKLSATRPSILFTRIFRLDKEREGAKRGVDVFEVIFCLGEESEPETRECIWKYMTEVEGEA